MKNSDLDCWMSQGKVWKVHPFFRERYKVDIHLSDPILEIYDWYNLRFWLKGVAHVQVLIWWVQFVNTVLSRDFPPCVHFQVISSIESLSVYFGDIWVRRSDEALDSLCRSIWLSPTLKTGFGASRVPAWVWAFLRVVWPLKGWASG